MAKKYSKTKIREMLSGHHLCGWVSPDRSACDCGHYDELTRKDPNIPAILVAFVEEDLAKQNAKT